MEDNGLPTVGQLEATPEILRGLIRRRTGKVLPIEAMIIRRLLPALAFAGTLAAQTFIQMSDPQFRMYTKNEGFAHETGNSIVHLD